MSLRREIIYLVAELGGCIGGVVLALCGDWTLAALAFLTESLAWQSEAGHLRQLLERRRA